MLEKFTIENLFDKNGNQIFIDKDNPDVLFDGKDYYQLYPNDNNHNNPTGLEMLSCTAGYLHAITAEQLQTYERIGKFNDNVHLFECD